MKIKNLAKTGTLKAMIGMLAIIFITASQCATNSSSSPNIQTDVAGSNEIIFSSVRPNPDGIMTTGIYYLDLETMAEVYLTPGRNLEMPFFFWSPQRQQVIYTDMADGTAYNDDEIYASDLNGHQIRLTNNNHSDSVIGWSPDGETISFYSRADPYAALYLYLMNPDGSNIRPLFDGEMTFSSAAVWSADSQRILTNQASCDLNIIDLETRETLWRFSDEDICDGIRWSPDNNMLLYLSDRDLDTLPNSPILIYREILTLDLKTKRKAVLTKFDVVLNPIWSPDSRWIAFSAGTLEALNLYLVRSNGAALEQLTESGYYTVNDWSPDGQKLLVTNINDDATSVLYILDVNDKRLEKIVDNGFMNQNPIWK